MKGRLFLIPSTISDSQVNHVIPEYINKIISNITHYIVENERTARRMLLKLGISIPIDDLTFYILNKHTGKSEIPDFLKIAESEDIGLLSEAGVPAVADPGREIVSLAHKNNIKVVPLVGPSSILLALMASGLNGQNFAFIGYLPVKSPERVRKIKEIETRSKNENQSQIIIEAPYRNNQLLNDILTACGNTTLLCIAVNITDEKEKIETHSIEYWRRHKPDIHKIPSIFIVHKMD